MKTTAYIKLASFALAALLPCGAYANMIVVEPDDFALGEEITNPYVNIKGVLVCC